MDVRSKPRFFRSRASWRSWLARNHARQTEVWVLFYKKSARRKGLLYAEAVEEALCFGWIDGVVNRHDLLSTKQRFTPRRKRSSWSELNKERARRLIAAGQMTPPGFLALGDAHQKPFTYPKEILAALKKSPKAWRNFQKFPEFYKRIRIGYIQEGRRMPAEYARRLANFIRQTELNKVFGSLRPEPSQ